MTARTLRRMESVGFAGRVQKVAPTLSDQMLAAWLASVVGVDPPSIATRQVLKREMERREKRGAA